MSAAVSHSMWVLHGVLREPALACCSPRAAALAALTSASTREVSTDRLDGG